MAKMSLTDLKAILQAEKSDALSGMNASKLSEDRGKAIDYYLGDMTADMPAPADRSKAVSTDVADTVEGLMPWMMDILCGGDEVVRFEPVGQEDEAAAEQETDYVNHVFMQKNQGFLITYEMVKDALLSKTGIAKVWWEREEREERETYINQSADVYGLLAADESVNVVEHAVTPDGTHDITIATKRNYQCAKVMAVPPEEFGISRQAKAIRDSGYCFHETTVRASDLISQGYDEDQIKSLPTGEVSDTSESQARDTVDEISETGKAFINAANRPVKITEHYVLLDYEGDGEARLYRVKTGGTGDDILLIEGKPDISPEDFMPFAAMTPIIMPHRFFGRSVADQVMDLQRIKTALTRALLDNAYLANNQRLEIAEEFAGPTTIDDMLSNRIGGIVRTKRPGGLLPIPNQPIGDFAFPMIEYVDASRELRTGVTRQGQGISPDALRNQTAQAVATIYSAAQARIKMIARIFAETGFRDLFQILHATIRKNDRETNTVKLKNKWTPVNPRDWKTRDDLTIQVGLGTGTKDQQFNFLMSLLGIQKEALMLPQAGLVDPSNIYNTLKKIIQLGGLKAIEPYFSDPKAIDPTTGQPKQPPPPPPDPKMVEVQGRLQLEQQKAAVTLQADQAKAKSDAEIEMAKLQAETQLKREQLAAEMALKREQIAAELRMQSQQFEQRLALDSELGHANVAARAKAANGAGGSSVHVGGEPG